MDMPQSRFSLRRVALIAGGSLLAILGATTTSSARQSGGRVSSMCDPIVWYDQVISATYYGFPIPRSYQFFSTYATEAPGTQSASTVLRSAVYNFPTLTSTDGTRIILEGEKIGGTCWEDPSVLPNGDTTWVGRTDLGQPYGGSVKFLYNAEADSAVVGGGGASGSGGEGGGGESLETCYYDVWIDQSGQIDWESAVLLFCTVLTF